MASFKFVSTRGKSQALSFSDAIFQGLAPDGGLYVLEKFPRFKPSDFSETMTDAEFAERFLKPFFEGDPLSARLKEICEETFSFPIPLVDLKDETSVLELFHGPTSAFKDVGARFLAACFSRVGSGIARTILVATSGDTGGAVAAAFFGKSGIEVGVLFPRDGVSERQKKQLTCWGGNIRAFSVRGSFDDCQRVVKSAFQDEAWRKSRNLTSANSINIGRLLPQAIYHARASLRYLWAKGEAPGFVVPAGNMGNALAALWARELGFPIRHVALATNANRTLADYYESGNWKPRRSVKTLANAMDVGDPSNMERVFHLHSSCGVNPKSVTSALSVDDETIRHVIAEGLPKWGRIWCPHTATAVYFREKLKSPHWIIVATAHPAKFETIVEPLVGRAVDVPAALARLLSKPSHVEEIDAEVGELKGRLPS